MKISLTQDSKTVHPFLTPFSYRYKGFGCRDEQKTTHPKKRTMFL